EALLEGHDELDEIEAVGVEVSEEAGSLGDSVTLDPEDGHRRVSELFEHIGAIHGMSLLSLGLIDFGDPSICDLAQRPMPRPPSTGTTAPVMKAAASEHRNVTAAATSSGVPK